LGENNKDFSQIIVTGFFEVAQGQEYSMSRFFEVLHSMDAISDVFKDQ
jgi:hypothetical protein